MTTFSYFPGSQGPGKGPDDNVTLHQNQTADSWPRLSDLSDECNHYIMGASQITLYSLYSAFDRGPYPILFKVDYFWPGPNGTLFAI